MFKTVIENKMINIKSVLYRSPNSHYPKAIKSNGMYIQDTSGKSYLDMSGGAAVSVIGHSNTHVIERMKEQLSQLSFAHTSFFTNEPQEELAQRLAERFTEQGARAYFTSGGSEANETAIKLAWQYWQIKGKLNKKIIISRQHSYHGNTFGTLSISGNDGRRLKSAAPLIDWPRISACYAYRYQQNAQTSEEYGLQAANELEIAILTQGEENVAAFICEPVVGSSLGVVPAVPGYLKRIRQICDQYNVLLISDEIMCGSGRTGTYFAHEQDGVIPDITTLAKGIAGGYQPLAATLIRAHMVEAFDMSGFAHGHTYVGHPVACVAGCAVQDVLDHDNLLSACKTKGVEFSQLLLDRFKEHPQVGDIRGRGLFQGIELVSNKDTKAGFSLDCNLANKLTNASMEQGLICYPGNSLIDGEYVPHILLAPPLILNHAHMEECVDKIDNILGSVF